MKKSLVSALQEYLRTFIQGMIIPLGGASGVIISGIDVEGGGFNIRWILVASILAAGIVSSNNTALIAAIDKWLHKEGIETPLDFKALDELKK